MAVEVVAAVAAAAAASAAVVLAGVLVLALARVVLSSGSDGVAGGMANERRRLAGPLRMWGLCLARAPREAGLVGQVAR